MDLSRRGCALNRRRDLRFFQVDLVSLWQIRVICDQRAWNTFMDNIDQMLCTLLLQLVCSNTRLTYTGGDPQNALMCD